jgi:WD40 repeat protein
MPKPPVLFLAFANDLNDFLPDLAKEVRALQDLLEQPDSPCRLVLRPHARLLDIERVFQHPEYKDRIAVFHFGGHADAHGLRLESDGRDTAHADVGGLAQLLGAQNQPPIVVLNACSSQRFVSDLLDAGIPAVVATERDVADALSVHFAAAFYRALVVGNSLARAVSEAQAAVRARNGEVSPWHYHPGHPDTAAWRLTAHDPLFGLPPLPADIGLPDKPFRHLHWFERHHAQVFFGRGKPIRELYERVTDPNGEPLILLYGQSGAGKSSLLAAGLLPRLERNWEVLYLRREAELGLWGTLHARVLNRPGVPSRSLAPADTRQATAWHSNTLIVLDQVEELYTRPHSTHEFEEFCAALRSLSGVEGLSKGTKLILGFRKEWLAEIESQIQAHQLPYQRVFLESLNRAGIIEAITGPARGERLRRKFGLSIEDGLAERIADTLSKDPNAAIAPTLQILLGKLWDKATETDAEQPRFSLALYETLERDGILLQDFLAQQLAHLAHSHPAASASGLVLDILALHTTPLGTAAALPRAELERLYAHQAGVLPGLLQACQDLYLLTVPAVRQKAQPAVSRLAHDTLAPLVRQHFDESDQPGQRARRVLENRGLEWQDGKTGAPLDDTDLALVENGREGMRGWTGDEERLLAASVEAQKQRVAEKKRQEGLLQKQLNQTLTTQSLFLADLARQAVEDDKPATAMRLALEALPGTSETYPERPFVATAYGSLSRALNRQYQGILQHDGGVGNVVFSSDGGYLLTYAGRLAYLWSTNTRQLVTILQGHEGLVNSAVFSPSGRYIVTASDDKMARLWNIEGRLLVVLQPHENNLYSASFSPNGAYIVTTSGDKTARLWDLQGQLLSVLQEHEAGVTSAIFSPDSLYIVTVSDDNTARLWDVQGHPIAVLRGHESIVNSATFSPDGSYIITASADSTVRLWNTGGQSLAVLQGHRNEVTTTAFSPDGTLIVTASRDGTAQLWDRRGELLAMLQGHQYGVNSATFNPDGTRIVTASDDKTVRLWDVQGQPLAVLQGHRDWVYAAAFSPDGTCIVTASRDKTARVWGELGRPLTILQGHTDIVRSATFSPDGTCIVTASADNTARLWNIRGQPLVVLRGHEYGVNSAAFSPDGLRIITASGDKNARLWSIDGQLLAVLKGHESWVRSAAFSPDSSRIVTIARDKTLRLWDGIGQLLNVLKGHEDWIWSVVFSPDGTHMVTASEDKTARLWNLEGRSLAVLKGHQTGVNSATFRPDGSRIVTTSRDRSARLWDSDGRLLTVLEGHEGGINSAAFSPDGKWIVTASKDKTARLWDADGKPLAVLQGHENQVIAAIFSLDGSHIVTVSKDQTVRLWDIQGQLLTVLQGHESQITSVAFSPDGRRIVTASYDKTARIWLTFPTLEEMIAYAQKMLPPRDSDDPGDAGIPGWRLTCEERRRFFLPEVERCGRSAKP